MAGLALYFIEGDEKSAFESRFKLGSDSKEKLFLLPGKLGRSNSKIGRSYSAKLRHFLSI